VTFQCLEKLPEEVTKGAAGEGEQAAAVLL
jgi:hypothetical protein